MNSEVVQMKGLNWGKGLEKVKEHIDSLDGASELITAALRKNKDEVSIELTSDDDTRWDRSKRKIFVYSKKSIEEKTVAVLFELHNAANDPNNTNTMEARLKELSENDGAAPVELSGIDYLTAARVIELDEFTALDNYRKLVEKNRTMLEGSNSLLLKKFQEKYADLLTNGELDYEKYQMQNMSSGHTKEMAQSIMDAYEGKEARRIEGIAPKGIISPEQSDERSTRKSKRLESKRRELEGMEADSFYKATPALLEGLLLSKLHPEIIRGWEKFFPNQSSETTTVTHDSEQKNHEYEQAPRTKKRRKGDHV